MLADRLTVINYDRRGRGASGDNQPYALERELEDLAALITATNATRLFGISSGAMLSLRAVASGVTVEKLVVYEPPLVLAGSEGKLPPDRVAEIQGCVRDRDDNAATHAFMRMVGVPGFAIPIMKLVGVWKKLLVAAPTLPHDFAMLGDTSGAKAMPAELSTLLAKITIPTVVSYGGKSPHYLRHAAEMVQRGVPGATLRALPGQTHNVGAKPMAAVLAEVFSVG